MICRVPLFMISIFNNILVAHEMVYFMKGKRIDRVVLWELSYVLVKPTMELS